MKKRLLSCAVLGMCAISLASCGKKKNNDADPNKNDPSGTTEEILKLDLGYAGVSGDMVDFTKYDESAYRKVSNASELLQAIKDATLEYTTTLVSELDSEKVVRKNVRNNATNWNNAITKGLYLKNADGTYTKIPSDVPYDPNDTTYTASMTYYEDSLNPYAEAVYNQTLTKDSSVHIIEITNDIEMGWNHLTTEDKALGVINLANSSKDSLCPQSTMYKTHGMSHFLIERVNDLLIYSKNGAKLTHGGFKINFSKNVVVRNLEMDEMWQWEDASSLSTSKVGDYDSYTWAYFKIGYSQNIVIDHCSFGKAWDGLIDVSNPYYGCVDTYQRAPYQGDGTSSVQISNCDFHSGSDDKDGYLYKMMEEIEADYKNGGNHYLYYNHLRESGLTFNQILYGYAIPHKKAFLLNDDGTEYFYNTYLRVSIANCKFTNIEDRVPKVRGGVVYMYNCIVDNSQYYAYREELVGLGAKSFFSNYGSSWNNGLTSQCIVCGNGGSVAAKNCKFIGISSLLKNNDTKIIDNSKKVKTTANGGYLLTNCSYKAGANDPLTTTDFSNASTTTLREDYFTWRTSDGRAPFNVATIDLSTLDDILNNETTGVGCKKDKLINFVSFK